MSHDALKERVCAANREISRVGLAIMTWGNASEADRDAGIFAIKPSGVAYDDLTPADIVLVAIETGLSKYGLRHLYRCLHGCKLYFFTSLCS